MLRQLTFIAFFIFTTPLIAQVESIVLQGIYQDKNLYFQNPESDDGFGFSAQLVRINGDIYSGNINSSAFEIDFKKMGIDIGNKIEVLIEYIGDVAPKPLNIYCIQPESTYKTSNIEINNEGLLTFTTSNEKGSLPFIVQHYRWNKWNKVGEVNGAGSGMTNNYQFKAILHSGENSLRIVQKRQDGSYNVSPVVNIENEVDEVKMEYQKTKSLITFSAPTFYEIHNAYGILLKKGYGSELNIRNLSSYNFLYLSYDNDTKSFKP